jgi:hypothetical protein
MVLLPPFPNPEPAPDFAWRAAQIEDAIVHNERSIAADEAFLEAWGDRPFPTVSSHPLSSRSHA